MTSVYSKIFELLNPHERRRFYLLLGLIIATGIVDMLGVASILPFLGALANPEIIETTGVLAQIYGLFGFQSTDAFMIFLGIVAFAIILFGFVIKILTLYAIARFGNMRNYTLSKHLLRKYLAQPYIWFLNQHSAALAESVLFKVDRVVGEVIMSSIRAIANVVSILFLFGLLMAVNPLAAFGAIVLLGGMYAIFFFSTRKYLLRIGHTRAEANQERYRIVQDAFGGIKDVKLLGVEDNFLDRFSIPAQKFATTQSTSQVLGEAPRYFLEAVIFGGMVLLILTLLLLESRSVADILPTLGVFAFAGLRLFPAMQGLYHSLAKIRVATPMLDRVHHDLNLLGRDNPVHPKVDPEPLQLANRLEILDLHFSYPQAEKVALHGFSLSIAANTTVGIVGSTGAGKTTAVDVMLGLLPTQHGKLLVDGIEITEDNLRSWQNLLGYVPQQIFLIDDTVSANIAFGILPEKRDHAAIENSARLAELHDFITLELPNGYNTTVGERGVRLSGGQRQRIGIARALYNNPDILILDEATSALDNLTEQVIMEAVRKLADTKTIIIVAHRLSTVRNCDKIFLLENGRLAGEGSYDELMRSNATFQSMVAGGNS